MASRTWRVKSWTKGGELISEVVLMSLHSLTLEVGILARREEVAHIDVEIEPIDEYGRRVDA